MYEVISSEVVFILCEDMENETIYLCPCLYKRICNHIFSPSNKVLRIFDSISHWKYMRKWESLILIKGTIFSLASHIEKLWRI